MIGQSKTPAVRFKDKSLPKIFIWSGDSPSVFSREKIFTPIISAIKAFAIKKPARIKNSRDALSLRIPGIIEIKNVKEL
jgi:hypothetical protein